MKFKDIKIKQQLYISISIILLLVIVLAIVSHRQKERLYRQTELIYNHPLKVRRAIDNIWINIRSIQVEQRNVLIQSDKSLNMLSVETVRDYQEQIRHEYTVLYDEYLGPKENIDDLKSSIYKWMSFKNKNFELVLTGHPDEARHNLLNRKREDSYEQLVLDKIDVIDNFARNKADSLYKNALNLDKELESQLFFITLAILALSIILVTGILRSIIIPLQSLSNAAIEFHRGDYSVRSGYTSGNEFGVLANNFNKMARQIQNEKTINDGVTTFTNEILRDNEPDAFFENLLATLLQKIDAVGGAIYMIDDFREKYNLAYSAGLDEKTPASFSASAKEGELGKAIITGEIQHIKDISKNTMFRFKTVSGELDPSEIITIPIISEKKVAVIISLITVGKFKNKNIKVLKESHKLLTARINNILAYNVIVSYSNDMDLKNKELETQKNELNQQQKELSIQNTELHVQKDELNEASKMKTAFLSNMSHELRTPLNSVIALSGVLNRKLKSKIGKEEYSYLDIIERNGKHLLSLINNILDISRIEAGKEVLDITHFNINDLLSEISALIRPQATKKGIKLIFSENNKVPNIKSDYAKCIHIFQNIIGNAIKFTNEGKVTIIVKQDNNNIRVDVKDTGIGIDNEELLNIFNEFKQVDNSNSRRFEGTGLGLAISKRYATMLNGKITVESNPNEGSVFSVLLPVAANFERMEIDAPNHPSSSDNKEIEDHSIATTQEAKNKTILVVEDSKAAIIQISDILKGVGYQVALATNGKEALQYIDKTVPDGMILDLMMPEIDGFEVLKQIRNQEQTAALPVIILTAKYITKAELSFLKKNNVRQLIQKGSVDRDHLLEAVAKLVVKQKAAIRDTYRPAKKVSGTPVALVVEDNPDNMTTIKALLTENYQVLEAVDGYEGIEKARKHIPDIILMDIALPGKNGIEALIEIRKDKRLNNTPVVAVTASAMVQDKEELMNYGFDAYISKPIDNEVFDLTIKKFITV